MLDANPLLALTCIDIGNHRYTQPCANIVGRHFAGRFSFRIGASKIELARLNETAREFDIIHLDGSHDERVAADDWAWIMRHAASGCCLIVDDAYGDAIDRLIGEALSEGYLRPANLPIPTSGENRVFFRTRAGSDS